MSERFKNLKLKIGGAILVPLAVACGGEKSSSEQNFVNYQPTPFATGTLEPEHTFVSSATEPALSTEAPIIKSTTPESVKTAEEEKPVQTTEPAENDSEITKTGEGVFEVGGWRYGISDVSTSDDKTVIRLSGIASNISDEVQSIGSFINYEIQGLVQESVFADFKIEAKTSSGDYASGEVLLKQNDSNFSFNHSRNVLIPPGFGLYFMVRFEVPANLGDYSFIVYKPSEKENAVKFNKDERASGLKLVSDNVKLLPVGDSFDFPGLGSFELSGTETSEESGYDETEKLKVQYLWFKTDFDVERVSNLDSFHFYLYANQGMLISGYVGWPEGWTWSDFNGNLPIWINDDGGLRGIFDLNGSVFVIVSTDGIWAAWKVENQPEPVAPEIEFNKFVKNVLNEDLAQKYNPEPKSGEGCSCKENLGLLKGYQYQIGDLKIYTEGDYYKETGDFAVQSVMVVSEDSSGETISREKADEFVNKFLRIDYDSSTWQTRAEGGLKNVRILNDGTKQIVEVWREEGEGKDYIIVGVVKAFSGSNSFAAEDLVDEYGK